MPEKLNKKGTSKMASLKPAPSGKPCHGSAPLSINICTRPCFMDCVKAFHSAKELVLGATGTSFIAGSGLKTMPPGWLTLPTR